MNVCYKQLEKGAGELQPFSLVSVPGGPVCGLSFAEATSNRKWNLLTLSHSASDAPVSLLLWEIKDGALPRKKQAIAIEFPPYDGDKSNTAAGGARLAMDFPGGRFAIVSHG